MLNAIARPRICLLPRRRPSGWGYRLGLICLIVLASATTGHGYRAPEQISAKRAQPPITHVWVIVEENHDWADVVGNTDFPSINGLLTVGAHAENYHNVPVGQTLHPSEPNYIVLEAGDALGLLGDDPPSATNSVANH